MSLNKTLKSFFAFAMIGVFALSIATTSVVGAATPASTSDKKDDHPYVTLIRNTNKENPLQNQGTKQALARMKECNTSTKNKETGKIKMSDWSACLDKKVQARSAQCDKYDNARQKNTCKLEVAKLSAAAKKAQEELAQLQAKQAAANAKPKDYQTCMTRYVNAKNTDAIKKSAAKTIDNRIARINKLQEQANLIPDQDIKASVQQELNSDLDGLNKNKATVNSKNATPADIAVAYCGSIFRLQVTTHLNKKVLALIALNKGLRIDTNVMKQDGDKKGRFVQDVNQATDKTIKNNPLKTDIVTRLDSARTSTTENITAGNALLKEVQDAKVTKTGAGDSTNYQSTLPKDLAPRVKEIQKKRALAWRSYNEAQVLRNTPNYFSADLRSQLNSVAGIRFLNENDNVIKHSQDGTVSIIVSPKNVLAAKKAQIKDEQQKQCAAIKKKEDKQSCRTKIEEAIMTQEGDGQAQKGPHWAKTAYVKVKVGNKDDTAKLKRASQSANWRPATN